MGCPQANAGVSDDATLLVFASPSMRFFDREITKKQLKEFYKKVSTKEIRVFNAGVFRNAEGEVLEIPDKNWGAKNVIVDSRTAGGEIDAFRSENFSARLSLMGNRVGMLCGSDQHAQWYKRRHPDYEIPTDFENNPGKYVYLSEEFTEAGFEELEGKNYQSFKNCQAGAQWATHNDPRHMVNMEIPLDDYHINAAMFTTQGDERTDAEAGKLRIVRAKAYKYVVNGQAIYVIIGTITRGDYVPVNQALDPEITFSMSF